ncbi:MAG: L,D-transpeptidase [Actinomycetota bacterium]|nr:L,D-transpeptidase [Actinomycetota bacterium]
MRVKLILGIGATAMLLSACGPGKTTAAPVPVAAAQEAPPITTTRAPTTVKPTTTTAKPKPKPTMTKTKPKPKPTATKTKPTTAKPAPKPVAAAPCSAKARACIDLSANQSWLMSAGKVVYGPVPITHGKAGFLTPPGTFHVGWKDIDHKSSEFDNAPMPYSVFFHQGIAFHEGSLKQKSHGCIHLSNAAAKKFYNDLKVGDVVQVVR